MKSGPWPRKDAQNTSDILSNKFDRLMKTVRLITCDGAFQARLIQGALENEGIASVLHNENTSNILRGFTPTISGVDIFVYEDDYERAMALLERNQMIPEQLKYCPCCHSPYIKFVLKKSHSFRAFMAAIFSILAGAPPGTTHWEYVCKDCGAHFETPTARQRKETQATTTPDTK